MCFNANWNFYLSVKYERREGKKVPGSWDIEQDYNCLQEHMVVKPGQQSSGGFYSHQIFRVELQPCNSGHGWLFSLSNIWASIHIVVKTLGASACMDSATQFPDEDLLLFCLTSFSFHIPVQYLPPHHSSGTFWSFPEQMNKVFVSSSRQETSAGDTLTFSPRTGPAPWQNLPARKHSWKPTWVQVNRKESTVTRYIS